VALSVIVALVVAAIAITIGGHRSSAPSSHRGAHQTGAATMAATDFLAYLLPRNGADWVAGRRLPDFSARVIIRAETSRLRADGFAGPPVEGRPSQAFGSEDFPNMPVIRRTGNVGVTTLPATTDPASSLPPAKRKTYRAALRRCEASAPRPILDDNAQVDQLDNEWATVFTRVSASPAIRAANRRAAWCSRATPFPASSVGREIDTIEAKLTPLYLKGKDAHAKATNASGVQVLIRCFGAVEALRNRLMAAQRVRFLAQHAQTIGQLETRVNRIVAADEAKYGVKLGAGATG
jgi:hypothetical protein